MARTAHVQRLIGCLYTYGIATFLLAAFTAQNLFVPVAGAFALAFVAGDMPAFHTVLLAVAGV
jgi:hypothetical protein